MAVDKNLFLYDLAVVAIMKNEGPYVKEWLDYHLLAGVNHFYIYDNESPDNQKEVLQPYIDAGIVTYIFYPGKARQYEAYDDATKNFKFFCRYMAFIDADEFIFPQKNQSIVEVLDEILSDKPDASGLSVNWHLFGSNNLEKADLTKGVLERFTKRASDENIPIDYKINFPGGNATVKLIANPRRLDYFFNPHFANYPVDFSAVNENGEPVRFHLNNPPTVEKIVLNHYCMKSREEYEKKVQRGAADFTFNVYSRHPFEHIYNDEFDDSILKYRDSREKFSIENEEEIKKRVKKALEKNLLSVSPNNVPENFFEDKMETFLTCLVVSEKFELKVQDKPLSQYALFWIQQTIYQKNSAADWLLLFDSLPEILRIPGAITQKICLRCIEMIPVIIEYLRIYIRSERVQTDWQKISELQYLQRMLKSLF
ncbi:MAG: glycosyltransferase family 92 protein [Selenomonadaceae bacterium]|nr:glycosyltransferase family 92 protein [Selenomonadaceae bacterium]